MLALWILLIRLRKHALDHLFIPLVVGMAFETVVEIVLTWYNGALFSWHYLLSWRMLYFVVGVLLTYFFIMFRLINKELECRIDEKTLFSLQHSLDDAKSYFGLSVISLNEWFNPFMQVYLAKILNRKLNAKNSDANGGCADGSFEHTRALLFFSKADYRKATSEYMEDYYYGKCLAYLHEDCNIPLACLERDDIFCILSKLDEGDIEALGCYPRWTQLGPFRRLRRPCYLKRLRRQIPSLDCAIVEQRDGTTDVLRLSKHGGHLNIHDTISGASVKPYKKLQELIEEAIYDKLGTRELKPKHHFGANYSQKKTGGRNLIAAGIHTDDGSQVPPSEPPSPPPALT